METKPAQQKQDAPIDIVYVLGKGSPWNNNEIRFSVRSIFRHLTGFRKIWIIGENPGCFSDDVVFIQHPDEIGPHNADGNIIRKVLRACQEKDLTKNFLFINDDHFFIKPNIASQFPNLHKGDMNTFTEKYWKLNPWRKRLLRTRDVLNSKNLPCLHFDLHTPIIFNKAKFPQIMAQFDYHNDVGYTMKSLYGNMEYATDSRPNDGYKVKVFEYFTIDQINARIAGAHMLAINDAGINNHLKLWLYQQFPEPSPVETTPLQDKIIEIAHWENTGQDYSKGVEIYNKYFNNRNLSHLFAMANTKAAQKKLNYKLTEKLRNL